jgi:hypothetical protein
MKYSGSLAFVMSFSESKSLSLAINCISLICEKLSSVRLCINIKNTHTLF